jgi:mono/diheme cytochrome c family protein
MKKLLIVIIGISTALGFLSAGNSDSSTPTVSPETPLQEVLLALGEPAPSHYIKIPDPEKVSMGRQMVYEGRATLPQGGKSEFISKYYVCTDCHNQVREDPVLPISNPDARLVYAVNNGLKFLQSTTFWGMVNREEWYNDDYVKKYGSLVEKANKSLAESTQLCARECSSGRYLEEWELEALLHYFQTLQLKLSDILTEKGEYERLRAVIGGSNKTDKAEAATWLKSLYALRSPADFVEEYEQTAVEALSGNPHTGEQLWERSCMTCHKSTGPSQLYLDKGKTTLAKFRRRLGDHSNYDLYTILRKGTYAEPGHRQYMPHYTRERLSTAQLADIIAFIQTKP